MRKAIAIARNASCKVRLGEEWVYRYFRCPLVGSPFVCSKCRAKKQLSGGVICLTGMSSLSVVDRLV
jgi:predicted RNA-binding Zn-ribbon protein involved in translation (DUF1610 family)